MKKKKEVSLISRIRRIDDNSLIKFKKPTQDNAVSADDFMAENSDVKMKTAKVNYSDDNVKSLEQEWKFDCSAMPVNNFVVTPYMYLQSGRVLSVLYPSSCCYLLPPQILPLAEPMSESNDKEQVVQDKIKDFSYDEDTATLYWICKGKEEITKCKLANFEVVIEKIYTLVGANVGEERITLSIKGKRNVLLDISLDKLTGLHQELTKKNPEYRLYNDLKGQASALFRQYVSEVYEYSQECLPHAVIYKNAGWQKNLNGWHYYSATDENCQSDFYLAEVDTDPFSLVEWVGNLLLIADKQIMLPLLLHAHLGYTLKLFEEAGYNEQYILAMIGVSGSKKTSLARVLFSLFGDAIINFTSTDRAIELELMERQDSTMILDDLSSGSDRILAGKFEKILRQLGDSTGRKRSINSGKGQETVSTRCAVVLTAETDIDALSKSSKLRTLAVHLNVNSVNSDMLRKFQDDELNSKAMGKFSKLEQYMTLYIRFLEMNFDFFVDLLKVIKIKKNNEFGFARQVTIFNMLLGQVDLVLRFWRFCGMLDDKEFETMYSHWLDILEELMTMNEKRGKEAEPYILFLQAISQALRSGKIAGNKSSYEEDSCYVHFIGYKDFPNMILCPDSAYDYVINYYNRLGRVFTESPKALWDKFYSLGLLEVYEQKNHKPKLFKQVKVKRTSVYCLCLKWRSVEALLNQMIPEA